MNQGLCATLKLGLLTGLAALMLGLSAPPPGFVSLRRLPELEIDLRYSTNKNLFRKNVYGSFDSAMVHPLTFAALERAVMLLNREKKGWRLKVLDASRPYSVQRLAWRRLAATHQRNYFDISDFGSKHNYGLAVDVTLVDISGHEINMGTGFDDLSMYSGLTFEELGPQFKLFSSEQIANRQLLRWIMVGAGFRALAAEWWHFESISRYDSLYSFTLIE